MLSILFVVVCTVFYYRYADSADCAWIKSNKHKWTGYMRRDTSLTEDYTGENYREEDDDTLY